MQLWHLFLELTYFFQVWELVFSAVSLFSDGLTWLCGSALRVKWRAGLSELTETLTASSLKPE